MSSNRIERLVPSGELTGVAEHAACAALLRTATKPPARTRERMRI
jgi:hypothetical protein